MSPFRVLTVSLLSALTIICNGNQALAKDAESATAKSANANLVNASLTGEVIDQRLTPVNSTKALNQAENSVVRILVVYRGQGGDALDAVGMGSGFVVAPGYVVTNYHVIETPPMASSAEIYIVPHRGTNETYQPVKLHRVWVEGDLALLSAPDLKIAPLKLFLNPQKNQRIVAMGYPGVTDRLLKRGGTELLEPTDAYVTQGSIALLASTNPDGSRIDTLFHTAPLNQGNSGGPLLNECGQVVGINTWSATSTLSDGGDVDVSSGQYVATHVSALNTFLASSEITPSLVSNSCYAKSEVDLVKDDALSKALSAAALAQKQRIDEQKKIEAAQTLMGQMQLGALITLSVLVLILIALLIRKGSRPVFNREKPAPTAYSLEASDEPNTINTAPLELSRANKSQTDLHPYVKDHHERHIPWGWLLLATFVIVVALSFILSHGKIMQMLKLSKETPQAAIKIGTSRMVCEVDLSASKVPLRGAGPISFDFDAQNGCINGRKPYELMADGTLLSFTISDNQPARLELSRDGLSFTRSDYHLSPDAYYRFLAQSQALGSLSCASRSNMGQKIALSENLRKVRILAQTHLTVEPQSVTVWRCKKTAS